jgi:putative endonuclease
MRAEAGSAGFVYVLGSDSPFGYRTYVGWTLDLDRRLAEHNSGSGAKSTRGRVWCLIYAERLPTRIEAMRREWHLKRDRRYRRQLAQSAQGIVRGVDRVVLV